MKSVGYENVKLHDGFWAEKQKMVRNVTAQAVYDRFAETYRFDALRCKWHEEGKYQGHIYWDSDIAKWIEGVAYLIRLAPAPELQALAQEAIDNILANADEHGYFNSYYLCKDQDQRFTIRDNHELYCAGHLMEAAIAWRDATGDPAFLNAMCKYADYIEQVFIKEDSAAFSTPGHPELELALMKLYRATGEKRYLAMAEHFINSHGTDNKDSRRYVEGTDSIVNYNQDAVPLRQITEPMGHCVRALYLLCGMIDVALETNDKALADACRRCFTAILEKQMYITGGVGPTNIGEAFTADYHLPNRTAYNETCAAIALALFSHRMQNLEVDSRYGDMVERTLYNGILSGISLDGKSFFYENPLEIDPEFNNVNRSTANKERFPITQRVEVFRCSCCPPNLVRFLSSVGDYLYTVDEDTVYVHQYMASETDCPDMKLTQKTQYPADGHILLSGTSDRKKLALRIPGWCRNFRLNVPYTMKNGYAYITHSGRFQVELELDMPVTVMAANRRVHENAGRVAVMRGPVVYCAEGVDNGEDLKTVAIDPKGDFRVGESRFLLPNLHTTGFRPTESAALYALAEDGFEEIPLTLIPYYAFANRGTTAMQVWLLRK